MAVCLTIATVGQTKYLVLDKVAVPPQCLYELLDRTDLLAPTAQTPNNDLQTLYQQYFGFDADLFSFLLVSNLTAFATAFCAGAMWKAWSKVF